MKPAPINLAINATNERTSLISGDNAYFFGSPIVCTLNIGTIQRVEKGVSKFLHTFGFDRDLEVTQHGSSGRVRPNV